jgi:flagellar M-ring protein FliF
VVRERSSSHEAGSAGTGLAGSSAKPGAPASSTSEFDYQVGRRVEQTVSGSGGVKRMTVAVLVKQAMSEEQLAKLKEVVALAVGINPQRGDAVVVYSMQALASQQAQPAPALAAAAAANAATAMDATAAPADALLADALLAAPAGHAAGGNLTAMVLGGLVLLVVLAALAYALGARRRAAAPQRLSDAEREQMLGQVRQWIATPSAAEMPGRRP